MEKENAWNRAYWLELDEQGRAEVRRTVRRGQRANDPQLRPAAHLTGIRNRRAALAIATWVAVLMIATAGSLLWMFGLDEWRGVIFGVGWKSIAVAGALWYARNAGRAAAENRPASGPDPAHAGGPDRTA